MRTESIKEQILRLQQIKMYSTERICDINSRIKEIVVDYELFYGNELVKEDTIELKSDHLDTFSIACPSSDCDAGYFYLSDDIREVAKNECVLSKEYFCEGNEDGQHHHPSYNCRGHLSIKYSPIFEDNK